MNKKLFMICFLVVISAQLHAQRYFTREGKITFFSETPVENIKANNDQVLCIVDVEKGQVAVDMLIKSFEFKKKLMQEHFNENYLESDKYPKSTFKGTFEVPDGLKSLEVGSYTVDVTGEITIHGINKDLNMPVELVVEPEAISTTFEFNVKLADHDIDIPSLVIDKIAEEILVTAEFSLEPYKR